MITTLRTINCGTVNTIALHLLITILYKEAKLSHVSITKFNEVLGTPSNASNLCSPPLGNSNVNTPAPLSIDMDHSLEI